MQDMQNPNQTLKTESLNRSVEMNSSQENTTSSKTPLYSSPWLAFFYIIRQGWGQSRP
jgi:hypothetical protein